MANVVLNFKDVFDYKYSAKIGGIEQASFGTRTAINVGDIVSIIYDGADVRYYNGTDWVSTNRIFYGIVRKVKRVRYVYYVEAQGFYGYLNDRHIKTVYTLGSSVTAGTVIKKVLDYVYGGGWGDSHLIIIGNDLAITSSVVDMSLDDTVLNVIKNIAYYVGARVIFWQDLIYLVYPDGENSFVNSDFVAGYDNTSNFVLNIDEYNVVNEVIVEGARGAFQHMIEYDIDLSTTDEVEVYFFRPDPAPDNILRVTLNGRDIPLDRVSKVNDRKYIVNIVGYKDLTYSKWRYYNDIEIRNKTGITGDGVVVRLDLINLNEIDYSAMNTVSGMPTDLRFTQLTSNGEIELPYYVDDNLTDMSNNKLVVWVRLHYLSDSAVVRMYYGNSDALSLSNLDAVMPRIFDYQFNIGYGNVSEYIAGEQGQYNVNISEGDPIEMYVKVDCTSDSGVSKAAVEFYGNYNYYVVSGELENGSFGGNLSTQNSEVEVYYVGDNSWSTISSNDTANSSVSILKDIIFGDYTGSLIVRTAFYGFCGSTYVATGEATGRIFYVRAARYAYDIDINVSQKMNTNYGVLKIYYTYSRPYIGVAWDFSNVSSPKDVRSIKIRIGWINSDEVATDIANKILQKFKMNNVSASFETLLGKWVRDMHGWNIGFNVAINTGSVVYATSVLSIDVENGIVKINAGRRFRSLSQYISYLNSKIKMVSAFDAKNFPYVVEDIANNNVEIRWW